MKNMKNIKEFTDFINESNRDYVKGSETTPKKTSDKSFTKFVKDYIKKNKVNIKDIENYALNAYYQFSDVDIFDLTDADIKKMDDDDLFDNIHGFLNYHYRADDIPEEAMKVVMNIFKNFYK